MTPVLSGNFTPEDIKQIQDTGVGSVWFLPDGARADMLTAPTEALQAFEASILNTIEDMAKMGMRIISQEIRSHQSGVALDVRNAPQTAQLGTFSIKISSQISKIIRTMVRWRYDIDFPDEDLQFVLSSDYQTGPQGLEWLRLIYEMWLANAIPEDVFKELLRRNELSEGDLSEPLPEPIRPTRSTNQGAEVRPERSSNN